MAFFISRKKFQNIRPTNNGFTISQRKARHQRLGFLRLGGVRKARGEQKIEFLRIFYIL
ncbi:hypothetical protein LEP1GSC112_1756 [Leptospira interrogans serovar Pomona str. UT364]|nr:hypothetical protein LEP1GSC112_1756 [Leptospira interrogans serovar Pomona str. UT364]